MSEDSIDKTKEQLSPILEKIYSKESPVGIDAQHTHAIIIDYLQNITKRLDKLEGNMKR